MLVFLSLFLSSWLQLALSSELSTNSASVSNAPTWVTEKRINRVVQQVQKYMEWDIRKVHVIWYNNQDSFQKFHGYDSSVLAVSRKSDNSIHIGPRVTTGNFDSTFGHELVHIILFQKFKDSIPKWLEEGLANYIAKQGKVDYAWLASQPVQNIRVLTHPFSGTQPKLHYQISTAVTEMIASKCNLPDLLQLSVGQGIEGYLSTFCGISDLNSDFQKWMKKKNQSYHK